MKDDLAKLIDFIDAGGLSRRGFLGRAAAFGTTALVATSILPKGLRAEEPKKGGVLKMGLGGGESTDTLDPRVDTMHVFTRVDVMPESQVSVTSPCTGQLLVDQGELEPDCLQHTKVYLRFIVERDGRTTSPAVVKGACPTLDRVALGCLDHMPRWKPGLLKGVPVRVQMVMPIQFEPR